jgi:CubicO group peptidase (beta-lactamase class C family)
MHRMRPRQFARTCLAASLAACTVTAGASMRQSPAMARVLDAARAEVASCATPGLALAVVHRGQLVFAQGLGVASVESPSAVSADTGFQVGSVGKMLTAAAVLAAVDDGRLSLGAPVAAVVRGLDPVIAALTPHQLLSQTSGLRDMPGEHGEQGEDAHLRFARSLRAADRLMAPGQVFSYSNIGYSLAGLAAAEAYGTAYADLMAARVFGPLGMRRSTLRPMEAMTWPVAVGHRRGPDGFSVVRPLANDTRLAPAGYAWSTAADLARFAVSLLADRQRLEAMTTRYASIPLLFGGADYGYGLILYASRGVRVAEHAGSMPGYAAVVRLVPEHGFAVIALANAETPALRTADAAMEAFLPLQPSSPLPADEPAVPMTPDDMAAYAGRYENRGTFVLSVEQATLVLRQNDGAPLPVTRVGPDRFVAAGPNGRPRLRFLLAPAEGSRPAILRFALWAYRKVS